MKDIVMNEECFQDLTSEQMEIHKRNGFMMHITAKNSNSCKL